LVVVASHAALFGDWIVDDAAISFAYARNLADGYGLVAQPGSAPVEGYSNTLWVLLLSPFVWLGAFDHVWTPKLFSIALVGLALLTLQRALHRFTPFSSTAPFLAASLLAAQTGVVAWSVSGLENGLYLFLLSLVLALCLAPADARGKLPALAGIVGTAVALTRPDGILFLLAYPASLLGQRIETSRRRRSLLIYAVAAGAPLAGFLVFRLLYFGEWLPNSYVAKGGPRLAGLVDLLLLQPWPMGRLAEIARSIVGWPFVAWAPLLVIVAAATEPDPSYRRPMAIAVLLSALGAAAYVLLPPDWMPEFRYGTPFYLFFTIALSMAIVRIFDRLFPRFGREIAAVAACVGVSIALVGGHVRATRFAANAPISVNETFETSSRFVRAAKIMGDTDPSLLIADVGGPLMRRTIRIFDLGMLCDRRIAEYLGEGSEHRDLAAFHEYIFEEARPTFIATRAYHSWISDLDSDARFRRDYIAIREYEDGWIEERYGERRISGDFVRRDGLDGIDITELRPGFSDVIYPGCTDCGDASF